MGFEASYSRRLALINSATSKPRTLCAAQVRALAEKYFGGWRAPAEPRPTTHIAAPASVACAAASAGACRSCAKDGPGMPAWVSDASPNPGPTLNQAAASAGGGTVSRAGGVDCRDGEAGQECGGVDSGAGPRVGRAELDAGPPVGGVHAGAPGARRLAMAARAGPAVMQAYFRPSLYSPDAVALDVVWRVPVLLGLARPVPSHRHPLRNVRCIDALRLSCLCAGQSAWRT